MAHRLVDGHVGRQTEHALDALRKRGGVLERVSGAQAGRVEQHLRQVDGVLGALLVQLARHHLLELLDQRVARVDLQRLLLLDVVVGRRVVVAGIRLRLNGA